MKLRHVMIGAVTALMAVGPALAEVAALGSTQRGGTSQIGRALAAAISENSDIQMRPQELANTADYLPLVNAGELEFGISNIVQLYYAVSGTGMSEGRPLPNLKMVATLMPFRHAYIVRRDSEINTVADLKGLRAPVFPDGALGDYVTRAYLATVGMTPDDVSGVQVPNFPRMWNAFSEGSADVSIVVVGAANSREF
ncbi:MAG: TAXI family TRAP transporter solute-binding subunit, partial [Pseudomonadota bacterium]